MKTFASHSIPWQRLLNPMAPKKDLLSLFWTCLMLLSFHAPHFVGRHREQFPPHFFHTTLMSWISTISFIYRLKIPTLHSLTRRMQHHSFALECCSHDFPSSGILLHFLWGPKLCIQCYGLKDITCSNFIMPSGLFIFFLIFLNIQFFDHSWVLNWHTELSDTQLNDTLTLLWAGGGCSIISLDVSSNFKNQWVWDSNSRDSRWKISILPLSKALESLLSQGLHSLSNPHWRKMNTNWMKHRKSLLRWMGKAELIFHKKTNWM